MPQRRTSSGPRARGRGAPPARPTALEPVMTLALDVEGGAAPLHAPTARQRELRTTARQFAADVLRPVKVGAEQLPTPAERFAATKPAYEQLVSAGFLRACIRETVGGDSTCL